jgi:hypothetical protein
MFALTDAVMGATRDDIGVQQSDSEGAHDNHLRSPTMRVRLNYFAPLLAAGTIVAAIAVAPIAAATTSQGPSSAGPASASSGSTQPGQSCVTLGGTQSQCQSPGNAQVYDAPPQVDYFPYAGGAT